jgi:UDP-N-acetylglucosamine 2-epimerase
MPNSDADSRIISEHIKEFVSKYPTDSVAVVSLGKKRYYSALKYCTAVIGNSSSGIYEAPSFHVPTLNIGDRQKGRLRGASVVDVDATYDEIKKGLKMVLSNDFRLFAKTNSNTYEKPDSLNHMYDVLCNYTLDKLIEKKFYSV